MPPSTAGGKKTSENAVNSDMFIGSEHWKRATAVAILANLCIGATYISTVDPVTLEEIDAGYVNVKNETFLQKVMFIADANSLDNAFIPEELISFTRGTLFDAVTEKINEANLGLRVERPQTDSPGDSLILRIHTGSMPNLPTGTPPPIFSVKRGHMKNVEQFWSDSTANSFMFIGKNLGVMDGNGAAWGAGLRSRMFFHEDTSYGAAQESVAPIDEGGGTG